MTYTPTEADKAAAEKWKPVGCGCGECMVCQAPKAFLAGIQHARTSAPLSPTPEGWEKLLHKLAFEENEAHQFRRFPMSADYNTEAVFSRGFDAACTLIAEPLLKDAEFYKKRSNFYESRCHGNEDVEIPALQKERDTFKAELMEQARLNGMGAGREAKLMAELEKARASYAAMKEALGWMAEDRGTPTFESPEQAVHYYSQFLFSYERRAKSALAKLQGAGEKV